MKHLKLGKWLLLLALLSIPVFGFLDEVCIRLWDESRLTMNAYEMSQNGNWIVTYFNGKPDMWNTKPPLLIWAQTLTIKIFGFNETAVRLPSAFATFFTCLAMICFSIRGVKSFWLGFISVMVLITSVGYVNEHSTRFGDYEAMITFFLTASSLCFFLYMETSKPTYLYTFFLLITLAVLTKSIVGLMFLPGLFLYTLWKKKTIELLKSKHLYIGIVFFLFFTVGYYLLRESLNPGYIQAVYENEMGGRFNKTIEGHLHPFSFYFSNIANTGFSTWIYLLPLGMVFGFLHKEKQIRDLSVFLTVLILSFLFIISYAETKLPWYDVPLYPFMSLLTGIFLFTIFSFIEAIHTSSVPKKNILPYVFLVFLFVFPYQQILAKTYKPKEDRSHYDLSYHLHDAVKGQVDLNGQYLVCDEYVPHLDCYIIMLKNKGIRIDRKSIHDLNPGDVVFFSTKKTKLENRYTYTELHREETVVTCKILGRL